MDPRFLKGAAAEYVTASWFLRQGYEVWWPSVQQSRVDFLAVKGRIFRRVQVKSARWQRMRGGRAGEYLGFDLTNTIPGGRHRYEANELDFMCAVYERELWVFPWRKIAKLSQITLDKRGVRLTTKRWRSDRFNSDAFRVT